MPLVIWAALSPVKPLPLPEIVPVALIAPTLMPPSVSRKTIVLGRGFVFAPVLRLVRPAPLPANVPLNVTPASVLVNKLPGSWARENVPLVIWEAFRPVNPLPFPEITPVALSAPTLMPPRGSRSTRVLARTLVLAFVARLMPLMMVAAGTLPIFCTTVASCVPVTSPASCPEKPLAVVAVRALADKMA